MGAAKSRLRHVLNESIKAGDLGGGFNLVLVMVGLQPQMTLATSSPLRRIIETYAAKLLTVTPKETNTLVVTRTKTPDHPPKWPSTEAVSQSGGKIYALDAMIIYLPPGDAPQSAIFYRFRHPFPLDKPTQTLVYEAMLKAFRVAKELSPHLRVDLDHHIELSPDLAFNLKAHTLLQPATIHLLGEVLDTNGFGNVAALLKGRPNLANDVNFRKTVLFPIYTLCETGVLTSLNLSVTKREQVDTEKQAWVAKLIRPFV